MIKILKAIMSILGNDVDVQAIVGDSIFPNAIPDKGEDNQTIPYPSIVMRRSELLVDYTKCRDCKTDKAIIEINCWSESYPEAVDLAEAARTALEFYKGEVEGIRISDVRLVSVTEDYTDAYYQQLTFTVR